MLRELEIEQRYARLRVKTRQALADSGIPSNPGFTDENILNALRRRAGIPQVEPWEEGLPSMQEAFVQYRNRLIATLEEAGKPLQKPITDRKIAVGIHRLLGRR